MQQLQRAFEPVLNQRKLNAVQAKYPQFKRRACSGVMRLCTRVRPTTRRQKSSCARTRLPSAPSSCLSRKTSRTRALPHPGVALSHTPTPCKTSRRSPHRTPYPAAAPDMLNAEPDPVPEHLCSVCLADEVKVVVIWRCPRCCDESPVMASRVEEGDPVSVARWMEAVGFSCKLHSPTPLHCAECLSHARGSCCDAKIK